ncbi:MAG: hypothetical protein Q9207_004780 [Kuettlingeria erythrocarpa]
MSEHPLLPLAVVGIGCRLPGEVHDTGSLWRLLVDGQNAWSPTPLERFNDSAFVHPNPDNNGTTSHRGGHFISQDIAAFDAEFFGVSPTEAKAMDPQQRLLLETSYEAFENAGITIERLRGSDTAVYAAIFTRDYDRNICKDTEDIPKYYTTGCGDAILSNRISYVFDLKGPSMTLDTGCSGSLVALHQACQSLRAGETSMALACGANLMISPDGMIGMSNLHMLNAQGRSYSFDARGSGYGRGEGIAAVVLKRLPDALSHGDPIHAIIRNTGVNQDGKTNGITMPSQRAQEALYRSVYTSAGIDPTETCYVEAHGTGTVAGDSVELQAVAEVFCKNRDPGKPLYLGSIKSNIGHLESSSGLAGLIKAILVLKKNLVPPNADFQNPRQALSLLSHHISVPRSVVPLADDSQTRRVSVNSFGYGGTNAHAILEAPEYAAETMEHSGSLPVHPLHLPAYIQHCAGNQHELHSPRVEDETSRGIEPGDFEASCKDTPMKHLIVVSANSQVSLSGTLTNLASWLSSRKPSATRVWQIANELACRRSLLPWRQYFVTSSGEELFSEINLIQHTATRVSRQLAPVFIFTGQSAQWHGMGRELFQRFTSFRQSLSDSEKILREFGSSWLLTDALYGATVDSRIDEGETAQPAVTAIQIALVDLLADFNVYPQTVIGHSSGEIAAAYTAGALSHRNALKVAYHRGSLPKLCRQKKAQIGAMLAVGLSETELLPYITRLMKGTVSVACSNSPTSSTLSGDEAAIDEVAELLNNDAIFNRRLKVDAAYHSHHMRHVAHEYEHWLGDVETSRMKDGVEFISSVTAKEKRTGFGTAYWIHNLVSKVRFLDALTEYRRRSLQQSGQQPPRHLLLEIGPHGALQGPIRQTYDHKTKEFDFMYAPTLQRGRNGVQTTLELAGKLFSHGYPIDLEKICGSADRRHARFRPMDLPCYSWDHARAHWHESQLSKEYRQRRHRSHDLLGSRIVGTPSHEPRWRHIVNLENSPWLAEHVVDGLVTFPGAAYLCMAIEALRQLTSDSPASTEPTYVLQDVVFEKALIVPPVPEKLELQLAFGTDRHTHHAHSFRVSARSLDETWHEYCRGRIMVDHVALSDALTTKCRFNTHRLYKSSCNKPQDMAKMYGTLRSHGNAYGPLFASIESMTLGDFQALSKVRIPRIDAVMPYNYHEPHVIHPATLDSLMHTSLPMYATLYKTGSIMPVLIEQLQVSSRITAKPDRQLTVFTELEQATQRNALGNSVVFDDNDDDDDDDGTSTALPVLAIDGMKIVGIRRAESPTSSPARAYKKGYEVQWAEDVDYARASTGTTSQGEITLEEYLRLLRFKCPDLAVLQVGVDEDEHADSVAGYLGRGEQLSSVKYDVVVDNLDSKQWIRGPLTSKSGRSVLHSEGYNHRSSLQECASDRYDLIFLAEGPYTVDKFGERLSAVQGMLKAEGRLVVTIQASSSIGTYLDSYADLEYWQRPPRMPRLLRSSSKKNTNALAVIQRAPVATISSPRPVIIVSDERYWQVSSTIGNALWQRGIPWATKTWSTLSPEPAESYVLISDSKDLGLCDAASTGFERIRRLLSTVSNAVWITSSGPEVSPDSAVLLGLLRTACSEYDQLRTVAFDVDEALEDSLPQLLQPLTDILVCLTRSDIRTERALETEYILSKRQLLISRLVPSIQVDDILGEADGQRSSVGYSYVNDSYPLRLSSDPFHADGDVSFERDDSITGSVKAEEIVVKVQAQTIGSETSNLGLTSTASGRLTLHEFAGTVSAVGEKAQNEFCIGDRVHAWSLSPSSYATYSLTNAQQLCRVPKEWDTSLAAASVAPIMKAYYALVEVADLRRGQTVLLIGDDCTTVRAAVLMAKSLGADVMLSGVAASQRNQIAAACDLPLSHVLQDSSTKLGRRLHDVLGRGHADVLLCTSAAYPLDMWDCIAAFGTIVQAVDEKAVASHAGGPLVIGRPFTFVAFDLFTVLDQQPAKIERLLQKAQTLMQTATVKPPFPLIQLPMDRLRDAIKIERTNSGGERIVLDTDSKTQVQVRRAISDRQAGGAFLHQQNATYVVAGGLGDIGRILCELLASLGAGEIVILSRRTLAVQEERNLQCKIEAVSRNTNVHVLPCDISILDDVARAAQMLQDLGLPPVRGVIHAATVLDVDGTVHLHRVFASALLDHFIMLSSLSGVIGSRGQGNYVAGNVFQDRFAWTTSTQAHSETRYLAIDLGLVESTSVYQDEAGQKRVQNLLRQGFVPVDQDQLKAVLTYALSPNHSTRVRQIVVGINGESLLEAENATPVSRSPMFNHVRASCAKSPSERRAGSPASLRGIISTAKSRVDASRHIASALSIKLAQLISVGQENLPSDVPLLDFGLDSLTAVDLKSWIQKECDATVQPSEILDQPNLQSLADKVMSRSTIALPSSLSNDVNIDGQPERECFGTIASSQSVAEGDVEIPMSVSRPESAGGIPPLPHLPLNKLQTALDTYVTMAEPFLSIHAIQSTRESTQEFAKDAGSKLQAQLSRRMLDRITDSWQHDLQVSGVYLARRKPIHPYGTFYLSHRPTQHEQFSQPIKAAIVSAAANGYRLRLESKEIGPDTLNGEPLCMSSQDWLFNAVRLPGRDIDTVKKHPGNDYLVAMRKGHLFKIPLMEAGRPIPSTTLASAFNRVLTMSTAALPSAATLTADDRNSWAKSRDVLQSTQRGNAEALHMVEGAAFVVCLDDSRPLGPSDRCNGLLLGDPANRWSDKTLQFVIFEDGTSGHICEHSMLDALSLRQLNASIDSAIAQQSAVWAPNKHLSDVGQEREQSPDVQEYSFALQPDTQQRIQGIEADFKATHLPCEISTPHLPELSHEFFRGYKIPSKAGVQLVIQLAALMYYGQQYPSWETVSLMPFYKGRLDWIQTVSPTMKAFCRAALDGLTPTSETRTLLREAVTMHTSLLIRTSRGLGCMAHLEALNELARRDAEGTALPGIFDDPVWAMMTVTSTRKIKTDAAEGLCAQEAGFYMPDPESVLVHYDFEGEGKQCRFTVQSTVGRAEAFGEALQQAGDRVTRLLEEESSGSLVTPA